MTNETNGISLRRLKTFLTNLKNIFAEKNHSHATSDITGLDTALSSKATSAQGSKADTAVQSVKIGTTEYKSGTTVTLPSYPTSLPASDVSAWAKASSKPSYSKSEVGLGNVDNTADSAKSVKYATSAGSANSVTWANLSEKPSTFTPSSHTHTIANITNLQSTLDGKASSTTLDNNVNLNNITTPGFYNCGGANSLVNKPSNVDAVGLIVTHNASGSYYTQILTTSSNSNTYRRTCSNSTWSAWTQDKYTDTNTWRGIQDNLTSDSATDSLSAKQGKALKTLIDAKTSNTGTITGIKMNGASKGTSGVVDLGTVLTGGKQSTTSTADGGANIYTFSDGSTITVKNGSKGSTGATGANGSNGVTPTIKVASGSAIGSVGTPSVTASTSGTTTTFTFNYLKGSKGDKGDAGVNATTTAVATTSANGLMSKDMVTKLNGIASGATAVTSTTVSNWGFKKTDTNTWRGIQNNLTSTATDQSLSAYQGKVLKDLVDTKTTFTYSTTQPTSPASNAVWIG